MLFKFDLNNIYIYDYINVWNIWNTRKYDKYQ